MASVVNRLAGKEARSAHSVMSALGYELTKAENGRYRYERDGFGPYFLHGTPSDHRWFANFLAEMRRRHPDAAMFKRRKSEVPRSSRVSRKRRRRTPLSLVADIGVEVRPTIEYLEAPECTVCGRAWLSDLDHTVRACPSCGGSVSIARRSA